MGKRPDFEPIDIPNGDFFDRLPAGGFIPFHQIHQKPPKHDPEAPYSYLLGRRSSLDTEYLLMNKVDKPDFPEDNPNDPYRGLSRREELDNPDAPIMPKGSALEPVGQGETLGEELARILREKDEVDARKWQEFIDAMAAQGVVVEHMSPDDPFAKIGFRPDGGFVLPGGQISLKARGEPVDNRSENKVSKLLEHYLDQGGRLMSDGSVKMPDGKIHRLDGTSLIPNGYKRDKERDFDFRLRPGEELRIDDGLFPKKISKPRFPESERAPRRRASGDY